MENNHGHMEYGKNLQIPPFCLWHFFKKCQKNSKKISPCFENRKIKQYKGQKPLSNKMHVFFDTKNNRSAILFHMACMPSPHLLYGPHSSKKIFLQQQQQQQKHPGLRGSLSIALTTTRGQSSNIEI